MCICGKEECSIPFGMCHCGCGENAPTATMTARTMYRDKDKPQRFIKGHNRFTAIVSAQDRFWPKVNKDGPVIRAELGPCWLWEGTLSGNGYGQIRIDQARPYQNRKTSTHRMSWILHFGNIPIGQHVLHKCDNRQCCNPHHLFVGNETDNMRDASAKGRMPRGNSHHNGRFDDIQIREIRRIHSSGEKGSWQLSKELGVSATCIKAIVNRKTYAHIQ